MVRVEQEVQRVLRTRLLAVINLGMWDEVIGLIDSSAESLH